MPNSDITLKVVWEYQHTLLQFRMVLYGTSSIVISGKEKGLIWIDNLVYQRWNEYPEFATSDDKLLIEFLGKVKFKEIDYPKGLFSVFQAVAKAVGC